MKIFKKPKIRYKDHFPSLSLIHQSERALFSSTVQSFREEKLKPEFKKKKPRKIKELKAQNKISWVPIYDRQLLKHAFFSHWLKNFSFHIPLKSGEVIKEGKYFIKIVEKILSPHHSKAKLQNLSFVGIGGGSVGDFVGFLSSVFKRGVPFVFFPSTWLSAVDAAHGGKTALNVGGFKNQIGSFYPAQEIWMIKKLLFSVEKREKILAFSEILKMAFIEGKNLYQILIKRKKEKKKIDSNFLWNLLPLVIELKYQWILRDPREQKGIRQILNLGHTVGHVLEAYYKIPHGLAIFLGLKFTLKWSFRKNFLGEKNMFEMLDMIEYFSSELHSSDFKLDLFFKRKKSFIRENSFLKILRQDKKTTRLNHLNFVFLKKKGLPFLKEVSLDEIGLAFKKEFLFKGD